jgi:hypothetical protein
MGVMRKMARSRAGLAAILLLGLSGCGDSLKGAFEPIDLGAKLKRDHRIEMASLPIALSHQDPNVDRVGGLIYRGGLFLHSTDKRFGGLSGLLVSPDGARLLAVSTAGLWFTADLSYEDGRLAALSGARLAPMLDPAGKPLAPRAGVANAVTPAGPDGFDGALYVALDRTHQVWLYPAQQDRFKPLPQPVTLPEDAQSKTVNGGIKGLSALDYHTLFALSEDIRDKMGDIQGWLIPVPPGSDQGGHGIMFLKAFSDYKPADIASLPKGDVFVLERSFSLGKGAGLQIRRIKRADLQPYAVLEGDVIARLDVRYSIDNMEGLAVRTGAKGETLLYLVSNDNFNGLQRTVLLEFELSPSVPTAAR